MADSRAKIWFATFVLAVFCLGGIVGYRVGTGMPPPFRPGGPGGRGGPGPGMLGRGPGGPPPLPPQLVDRLSSELQLDAAQQDQIRKILEDRRDRFEQVHRDARERFGREQRELDAAIRGVLRPDQVERFDRFVAARPQGRGRGPR